MPLPIGSRLGPYEILAAIGAGGMGEVYRARDTKLGRDVAIKVLPDAFARDADRMARFQREAKVLASLNHTNIASIYGLEDSGSTSALVMELAEGPTLADRIAQGPISIDDALRIARQIADALEYAHEKGIIHRDLKPANVKVSSDDTVKVLDFGLAKALEGDAAFSDISTSPTLSRLATQAGILLGTASYMSPEQAKAKPVDRRADIWAFGCVLYEMCTGKKAFEGDAVTETLAAVLKNEPDWKPLPAATPMRVRVLLQRCLQKDSKQRLQAIGDARISLDEVLSGAPEAAPGIVAASPAWRRALPWAVASVAVLAALTLGWLYVSSVSSPAPKRLLRYEIFPPEKASFESIVKPSVALSPDGRHLAFTATRGGTTQLWVRDLDSLLSRPLSGTEGATRPFWSPDSRRVAFQAGGKLEEADISGGAPQVICNVGEVIGGSWGPDGVIVFGSYGALMKVSATGGAPSVLIKSGRAPAEYAFGYPSFLSDGRRFFYSAPTYSGVATYIGSLNARSEQDSSKPLAAGYEAAYAPASGSGPGRMLFLQTDGALMAQAFDPSRGELEGEPTPVALGVGDFSVSANGVLVYAGTNAASTALTWFDRSGKVLGTVGGADVQPTPAISPDDSTVAVPRQDKAEGEDLWLYNIARGAWSRLTFDGKDNILPVWSPDGSHIAFASVQGGLASVYEKAVNGLGQEEAIEKSPSGGRAPLDWSRDGRFLVEGSYGKTASVWILPLSPGQASGQTHSVPYLNEAYNEIGARLSPNDQWIAYDSDETGRDEIFVQTFPKSGGKWQVSTDGGTRPVWSRDGKNSTSSVWTES
jgi:eukaryotic-like serine/threonine-protein kinase